MAKKKTKTVLRMKNGEVIPVTETKGRFFICEGRQFRRSNPEIAEVVTEKVEKKEKNGKEEEDHGDL